ncbi:hypothetical protein IWW38_003327 [Coemansia aciculifera]|uniref:Uncharacterized protein n=1 Tax=Coemansia aciculifera TaxID=417176 RepID=A0ACC1M1G8_9FUNG|nr:hypothetical protein IWW38_003327 [Coemansia aciculifera]
MTASISSVIMPSSTTKRDNDHGFVFRRVRAAKENKIKENKNIPIPGSTNKRQASSVLDFPEPKRQAASPSDDNWKEVEEEEEELSVPLKKAPQPTPLISRTRTRGIVASTPSKASGGGLHRRRATAMPSSQRAIGRKSAAAGGRRRSTFSMRGKRASSIGGGFKAAPHESVAASDFYRHISPELPEPIRLRQLLAWCARRTSATVSSSSVWAEELPAGVRRVLDDALREAVDDLHAAFEKGAIATSWYHRPIDQAESLEAEPIVLADHPENLANRVARDRLLARVDTLRKEDVAWVRELKRAGAEHARALARLPTAVQALPAKSTNGEMAESVAGLQPIAVAFDSAADSSPDSLDSELAAAEQHIDCAVSELEVALDAFHLDAHRAAQQHALAVETCERVSAGLAFAFTQRRAHAQVVAATATSLQRHYSEIKDKEKEKKKEEGRDNIRDLLRTLAASLA